MRRSAVAILAIITALPIASAGRFSPFGHSRSLMLSGKLRKEGAAHGFDLYQNRSVGWLGDTYPWGFSG
jgi:hypothetical protein